jgi:O-antigen ligase
VSCIVGYFLVIKLTPYNMFARLANGATIESDEAFGRVPVLRRALGLFLDHPITGTSPLDPRTGIYPHTQLVELCVAAGVVGGVVMLYLLLRAATQVWRLSHDSDSRWVAALAIIAIGASFNSSSLFLDGRFWAAILLVLAVRPEPDLAGGPSERPTGEQVHV